MSTNLPFASGTFCTRSLGGKVAKDCRPTYAVSQFLSKVKPDIAQHLVLKAEEVSTLKHAARWN